MKTAENKAPDSGKSEEQIQAEKSLESIVNQAETIDNATGQPVNDAAAADPGIQVDAASLGISQMLVGLMATGAEMAYPCLRFDDDTKGQGAAVLAPVLAKHNLESAFFEKWKEEFAAGAFFSGIIFSSYVKVQAWKREQAAAGDGDAAKA